MRNSVAGKGLDLWFTEKTMQVLASLLYLPEKVISSMACAEFYLFFFSVASFFPSLYISVIVMPQIQKCCVKHQHNEECKDVVTLEKRIQV